MSVNRLLVIGSFLVTLSTVGIASGQGMPDVQRKALDRLVGTWKSEDRVGNAVVQVDVVVEWAADEAVLLWHMSTPGSPIKSTGIIGWDGRENTVMEHGFSTTGECFSASHKITPEKWEATTRGTRLVDGKWQIEESLRIVRFKSADEWEVVFTRCVLDGKEQPDAVGTLTRK